MNDEPRTYDPVDASPVKSFFVTMLTRDIMLEEAILDLLDNCVDGIRRTNDVESEIPYDGFWAEITFDEQTFSIADNCGGIPWEHADYAFRMGRDPERGQDAAGVVGVYGIGMKRAIFKTGKSCVISTQSGTDQYEVNITPDWLRRQNAWSLPVTEKATRMPEDGTTIIIGDLYEGIATRFGDESEDFQSELVGLIASHYAYIINKGFKVKVNDEIVEASTQELIYDPDNQSVKNALQPFMYKVKTSAGVEVFMAVGFARPVPSQDEIDEENEIKRYSSEDAGWTILCNDRAVLFCDKTEQTGWGEAGVPKYHTQFIAVSGVVEFRCEDPAELPMTTTKRGVDASSPLYLQVKDKMREGMKLFTDYTNHWKGLENESRNHFAACSSLTFTELKATQDRWSFQSTYRSIAGSSQFKPALPRPRPNDPKRRRISYMKETEKVRAVSEHLFDNADIHPSLVGEKCFDIIRDEALN